LVGFVAHSVSRETEKFLWVLLSAIQPKLV